MPIEIRRFGVGHRRPDGPAGTTGIEGQVIESGPSGIISELAFGRRARIVPHTNPNACWFLVIEGGGWVGVADERTRVTAGEAVAWPADVLHAAWTDGAPMRAIVVELPSEPRALPATIDGSAVGSRAASGTRVTPVARGDGALAPRPAARTRDATEDGEPL